jgi:hypothetical protein
MRTFCAPPRWVSLGRAELLAPIARALRFLVGAAGSGALAMVLAR